MCVNKTCLNGGRCYTNATYQPNCRCVSGYSGDDCENQSKALASVKQMISAASVIAILAIVFSYLAIIANDLHTIMTNPSVFLPKRVKKKKVDLNVGEEIHYDYLNS